MKPTSTLATCSLALTMAACNDPGAVADPESAVLRIEEATIAGIHEAMAAGRVTARELVELSLARIEAYDKQGPSLNAIITLNPNALERADQLDEAFAASGLTGPLHGIPMLVKDNYDTHDMPTTAGSLSMAGSVPPDDAFQVGRIREAGAIIIAKTNMAEFAFSPFETVGSMLPGHTRNPYDPRRVPAGSSGGTAAGVAASFAVVGLGTDTGNSIRGPSSHNALVGIRSTMGLTSRDGIVPLFLDHDIGGPMARTVADAAIVLGVIAGYDPADAATEGASGRSVVDYTESLNADALAGARLGVVRQLSNRDGASAEVIAIFESALQQLRTGGAEIVDPVDVPLLDNALSGDEQTPFWCLRFRYDLERYLADLGDAAPFMTLQQIVDSGLFHPSIADSLRLFGGVEGSPSDSAACVRAEGNRIRLRASVRAILAEHDLDALIYPTWANPPRLIGDLNSPAGDNSQDLSPHTGFPAITVPMGYTHGSLPAGLQLVGDAFSEARLIELAYAYEQATQHRRPPAL